ncbi:putative phage baseplate assembly protein [Stackebrandtia albiflava]|uniref:Putative phage baseplate assembly protein n=1 Tax=Stackebrandtia albiflava TaxID=406432 RepID=A0A562UPX8_9ACTN|nr:putative baseplate assembly protein [Stackebrandtia albiflava]TWJ07657.1 putative phage baseplate assembly protein [Stackebrandtia albiflava]
MSLPVPNLDDRRFQDLVDEAKRLVQQKCPEWTDHNVSDPGVTLIETFAMMVDQLTYRVNRIPESNYLRFLDLIGVRLYPPTAARTEVTYWLSAPQPTPVTVPEGSQIASEASGAVPPQVFQTDRELVIPPRSLTRLVTAASGGRPTDQTEALTDRAGVTCFAETPAPGDAVYFGLDDAAPRCAVLLQVDCRVEGVGVDPRDPPWRWQAWTGEEWRDCELDRDTTGGFNRPGDVVVHLPGGHTGSLVDRHRAGWIRCVLAEPAEGQPFYQAPPRLTSASATVIGGSVPATHCRLVTDEVVGLSEGVPGQRFRLAHRPVIAADSPVVEVAGGDGRQAWSEVDGFTDSGPDDRHFTVDRVAGELVFGPAVRQPDGALRYYGAVPPKGSPVRVVAYRVGGGRAGNVARGRLRVQRDPVTFVTAVTNRRPATGGVDGETVRDAAIRGPLVLRSKDRAVTVEDYEQLARAAAPDAARVRCVPIEAEPGAVRLLVVPAVADPVRARFAELDPREDTLARIAEHLDARRCLGARISVEPPFYQGVTVVARLRPRPRTSPESLEEQATTALYRYLNPLVGGPDDAGWPFGRPVQAGEVYAVLQRVPGVDLVEDLKLFGADPITGRRGGNVPRIDLPPHALAFSYGHQVRVAEGD